MQNILQNVWFYFMSKLNTLRLKWLLFSKCTTLQLIVPIIHGPTAEVTAMGFTFFYLSKLEFKRKWIETPTHGMSYRFDFDLSSNCKVKKYFHMSCGLLEIVLEVSMDVYVTWNFGWNIKMLVIYLCLLAVFHTGCLLSYSNMLLYHFVHSGVWPGLKWR